MEWMPDTWGEWEAVATIVALVVGASWTWLLFVRGRQKHPQADLSHSLHYHPLPDGRRLVTARVGIKNIGRRLIQVARIKVRIQRVSPTTPSVERQLAKYEEESAARVVWPSLDQRELSFSASDVEIEPGETDWVEFDLIAPADVEKLRFYAFVENKRKRRRFLKKRKRPFGWTLATVADVTPVTAKAREEIMARSIEGVADTGLLTTSSEEEQQIEERDPPWGPDEEKQQYVEEDPPDEVPLEEQQFEEDDPPSDEANGER